MILKEKLKRINSLLMMKKRYQSTKQIDAQCNCRSEEDWKTIANYMSNVVITLTKENNVYSLENEGEGVVYIGSKKYIRLYAFCSSGMLTSPFDNKKNSISLKDGKKLIIGQKDVVRFCKENHLKLKYYYTKYVKFPYISNKYDYETVDDYLICVS